MFPPLLTTVVTLLPLADAAGPNFNSGAILSLILSKVVPVILGIIGVGMLLGVRKQRMSALMEDVGKIVIIGIVIGASGLLIAFGGTLAHLIIN